MFLIYDTETTGLPRNYEAPVTDLDNWPRLVQLAWQLHDDKGKLIHAANHIVKPDGFTIPFNSEKIHGIYTEKALKDGVDLKNVLSEFEEDLLKADYVVGHNIDFDINIAGAEFLRMEMPNHLNEKNIIDTKTSSVDYCAIPGGRGGGFKWPKLSELYEKLFETSFKDAHNAAADVIATTRCFLELVRIGVIDEGLLNTDKSFIDRFKEANPSQIQGEKIKFKSNKTVVKKKIETEKPADEVVTKVETSKFSHLQVHSQFSVLQATPDIESLIKKVKSLNMPAVALTDIGNMFGAFEFVSVARKHGVKPIVGCELYVSKERKKLKFTKDNPDHRHLQVLLAKDKGGYENLSRLTSYGYIEGLYGQYPRVDKELIKEYKSGLIPTTGSIYSEIPELILNVGESQAEEALQWWLNEFGEDFYIQLNRHGLEEEDRANEVLLKFAKKYDIKIIAGNNVFYLEKEDAQAHDILLCVLNAEYQSTPIGSGRGFRYGFPNQEFYLKTKDEMLELYSDIPEAIENVSEIIDKVETYKLDRDPVMPDFPLPEGFPDPDEYLKHLTYKGAEWRYDEVTDEIRERIDFELETIERMGYPGYFLIVQDFLHQARDMGVSVGPGRGSAAGSVVAYCLRVTDVDPLKFNLLFERFLNPDRISLPDIDIDFDEDGRDRI